MTEKKHDDANGACSDAGLDEEALNKACWVFMNYWSRYTDQTMSGNTWNNLKPMVRAALKSYIEQTANEQN